MPALRAPQPCYYVDYRNLLCDSRDQMLPNHTEPTRVTAGMVQWRDYIQIHDTGKSPTNTRYALTTSALLSSSSSSPSSSWASMSTSSTRSGNTAKHIALLEQVLAECEVLERRYNRNPRKEWDSEQLDDTTILAMGFVPPSRWTREMEEESWRHYEDAFLSCRLRVRRTTATSSDTSSQSGLSGLGIPNSPRASPLSSPPALAIRRQAPLPLPIDPYHDPLANAYQETPPCSACTTSSVTSPREPLLFAPVSKKRLARRLNALMTATKEYVAQRSTDVRHDHYTEIGCSVRVALSRKKSQDLGLWTEALVGPNEDDEHGRGRSRTTRPIL